MGAEGEQGIGYVGCLIEVDDDRNLPITGGAAHGRHEFRETVVDENGVDIGDQCRGIFRQGAAKVDAAAGRDGFFARGIEQNERDRCRAAVDAYRARAIDTFVAEIGQNSIAYSIVGAAERPGERDAPFQPGDCDGCICRASPAGDDEFAGGYLCAGSGKILDAHDDVLHGDACAEDFWRLRRAFSQSLSRPPPRRG